MMGDDLDFGALRRRSTTPQFVPFAQPTWPAQQPTWPAQQPAWTPTWAPQPTPWTTSPTTTWTAQPAWPMQPGLAGEAAWWETSVGRAPRRQPATLDAWGPWLELSPNVQVRTRRNVSLAVHEHQPGLWSLGEVPTDQLRRVSGDGDMDAGVFQLLLRAVTKAVAPAIQEISKAVHKGKEKADVGCDGCACRCGR